MSVMEKIKGMFGGAKGEAAEAPKVTSDKATDVAEVAVESGEAAPATDQDEKKDAAS